MINTKLLESHEKEIFRELLSHPNQGPGRGNVQTAVAERHGVSLETVKTIERKGMARDWPPLD
jgi:hypothetical protein